MPKVIKYQLTPKRLVYVWAKKQMVTKLIYFYAHFIIVMGPAINNNVGLVDFFVTLTP